MASKTKHRHDKHDKRTKRSSIAEQVSAEVAPFHAPPPAHRETAFVRFARLANVVEDVAATIDRDE